MYSLGEYFSDGESLSLEFKEFFFKISPDIFFDESDIQEIITTGKWNSQLNSLVIINVKSYINYYLGKYISCFCNSKCNGEVIIGINDDSEITGIPFQGDINITLVKDFVFDYMTTNVKGLDDFDKVSTEFKFLVKVVWVWMFLIEKESIVELQ